MKWRPSRRAVITAAGSAAGLLLAGGIGAAAFVNLRITRMSRLPDPFVSLPESSRPSPTPHGTTVLLAGIDAESASAQARTDALLLVRVAPESRNAYVISIPRDSWVDIPGRGMGKINAAYVDGGAALMVQTVEQVTGTRVDHVAVIGWSGLRALTDAVGGVTISFGEDWTEPAEEKVFAAGTHRLNGRQGMWYVRERRHLPRGDLDRVQRHQHFLRALFTQLLAEGTLSDPSRLMSLFDAITSTTTVDSGFGADELWRLAMQARGLERGVRFMTAPVSGQGQVGDQSVVWLDKTLGPVFWRAVAADDIEAYFATHGTEVLGTTPR